MTKMRFFLILAAVTIVAGAIALLPRSQGKSNDASKSKIESAGLAEYGVEVVDPNQAAFSSLMEEKKSDLDSPFSVFVVNNSSQAIASCTLKWEIHLRDGKSATYFKTKKGSLEIVSDGGVVRLADGIPAKGNLLYSLTDPSSPDNYSPQYRVSGGGDNIAEHLSNSEKLTVSVDGVLFVDGTYVGPDTRNYFELFRGEIEAKRELDSEIIQLKNDGAKSEAIANHLEKVAKIPSSNIQVLPGENPQYSFGKWMQKTRYARQLLLRKKAQGDEELIEHVRTKASKPPVILRKLARE